MEKEIVKAPKISRLIVEKYATKWVALSKDYKKVIAAGNSLSEVLKKSIKDKEKVVMQVLPNISYIPRSI